MANFDTEEFNLVFYQIEIEKIWDNPTEESDFQEFYLPVQTEFWDGAPIEQERRAYTYTNYMDTNDARTVSIKTEFTGYNTDHFTTGNEGD